MRARHVVGKRAAASLASLAALALLASPALAAPVDWMGSDGASWSDASAWGSGVVPVAGDVVVLGAAPQEDQSTQDDIPALAVSGLQVRGAWTVERRNGAVVSLDGPFDVDLAAQEPTGTGHELLWLVPLQLTAPTTVTSAYEAGIVTLRAAITGGQAVRAVGPGQVLFQGSGPNDIGLLTVDGASGGRADVSSDAASPDAILVEDGAAIGFGDGTYAMPVTVGGTGTEPTTVPSSWAPGALRVRTNGQDVAPRFTGPVTLTAPTTFATSRSDPTSSLTFDGTVQGPFPVTLLGAGTIVLDGTTTVASVVSTVRELVVGGTVTGPVEVRAGSALSGPGTVGGLTLDAGSVLRLGSGADVPTSTGPVSLAGATLELAPTSLPAPGVALTVLSNASSDVVVGAFAGLAEGALVDAAGAHWQISYAGGDGNDVTVRRVARVGLSVAPAAVPAERGHDVEVVLPVANAGPDDALGTVSLVPPTGTVLAALPPGCAGSPSGPVTCPVSVPAAATTSLRLTFTVPATVPDGTTLTGSAMVSGDLGYLDDDPADDTAALTLSVTGTTEPPVEPPPPAPPVMEPTAPPAPTTAPPAPAAVPAVGVPPASSSGATRRPSAASSATTSTTGQAVPRAPEAADTVAEPSSTPSAQTATSAAPSASPSRTQSDAAAAEPAAADGGGGLWPLAGIALVALTAAVGLFLAATRRRRGGPDGG